MSNEKSLGDIASKIHFLVIRCTRLGNLRTSHVALNTNANESMFHTSKKLLDCPELKAIVKRDGEVKRSLLPYLLPYKLGTPIVPASAAKIVKDILDAYEKVERPALVAELIAVYDVRVSEAQGLLKEQFDATQYLTKEQVAAEYEFNYDMWNLVMTEDMKDKAQETIMSAAQGINDALAAAAQTMVAKLAESLKPDADGKFGKVYDKQFIVLQDFLAKFDMKNVASHEELKAEMDKLKALLAGVDPEKVRNNEGLRITLASSMGEATAAITAMVERKGRVFRDADPEVAEMLE